MPNYIKEHIAIEPVTGLVVELQEQFFLPECRYMVPVLPIVARALNALPSFYATSVYGKKLQLKKFNGLNPTWQARTRKIFFDLVKEYREQEYNHVTLDEVVNVNETIVAEKMEYLLSNQYKNSKIPLNRLEAEALVLNKMEPHFVATSKDFNTVKVMLNRRYNCYNFVRQGINQVLFRQNINEPLTDNAPTRAKKVESKRYNGSLKSRMQKDRSNFDCLR